MNHKADDKVAEMLIGNVDETIRQYCAGEIDRSLFAAVIAKIGSSMTREVAERFNLKALYEISG